MQKVRFWQLCISFAYDKNNMPNLDLRFPLLKVNKDVFTYKLIIKIPFKQKVTF